MSKKAKVYDISYKKTNSLFGQKTVLTTKNERKKMARKIKHRHPGATIIETAKPAKHRAPDWVDELILFDLIMGD